VAGWAGVMDRGGGKCKIRWDAGCRDGQIRI